MKHRYGMKTQAFMVEAEFSTAGKKYLEQLRKSDARFKHCRIRDWLQATPKLLPLRAVMAIGHDMRA